MLVKLTLVKISFFFFSFVELLATRSIDGCGPSRDERESESKKVKRCVGNIFGKKDW